MMRSYELDVAIVDGQFPASGYTEVLLDTDYLCLVVSPIHPAGTACQRRHRRTAGRAVHHASQGSGHALDV